MPITRRAFLGGMTAAAGAAVAPTFWAEPIRVRPAHRAPGPVLRVQNAEPSSEAQQADEDRRAAWLLLACMDAGERARVADRLEGAIASEQARRSPLLFDLGGERLEDVLREESQRVLPAWTAARSLSATRWLVPGTSVGVLAQPGALARAGDVRGSDEGPEPRDPWKARVRFAAWPVTRAVRLSSPDRESTERLAASLRVRACEPASTVGLVVGGALGLPGVEVERWREIGRAADRAELSAALSSLSVGLAAGPPEHLLPAWLLLEPEDLWVVPRMAALARSDAFREEVRAYG